MHEYDFCCSNAVPAATSGSGSGKRVLTTNCPRTSYTLPIVFLSSTLTVIVASTAIYCVTHVYRARHVQEKNHYIAWNTDRTLRDTAVEVPREDMQPIIWYYAVVTCLGLLS